MGKKIRCIACAGLAVSYSGGFGLADDVAELLEANKIEIK